MDSMVLTNSQAEELLKTLQTRFEKNRYRHTGIDWAKVEQRLRAKPDKLYSLFEMERTGGEPDVADYDSNTGEYLFFDCSGGKPRRAPEPLLRPRGAGRPQGKQARVFGGGHGRGDGH